MREILFRAKRIDDGKWVEGFYVNRFDVNEEIEHLIFWRKSYTVWEYAKIDPETLCQYTGLNDKNGNRIWENDIVDTPYRRFVVTYSDGVWGDRDGVAMRESIFRRRWHCCWKYLRHPGTAERRMRMQELEKILEDINRRSMNM